MTIGDDDRLQALRGLAALCVLIHHSLRVLGPVGMTGWIADVILNAHAAVVIFFVLSGYVLSKSLLKRGFARDALTGYYVRRGFRIYPALWVACTLGLMYFLFARTIPAPHFAAWAAEHYAPARFGATTLILSYAAWSPYLVPPLWTILIELVCSAILPVLVMLFARRRWTILPTLLLLVVVAYVSERHSLRGVLTNLVHFALGAGLAVFGPRRVPKGWPVVFALIVLVFFRQLYPWPYAAPLPGLVEGFAGVVVIAGILNGAFPALSHRSLRWLGDVSYSVYLFHLPIAYTIARLIDRYLIGEASNDIGPICVAAATLIVTLPLAAASYRYVERPGIALGKRLLAARESGRGTARAVA